MIAGLIDRSPDPAEAPTGSVARVPDPAEASAGSVTSVTGELGCCVYDRIDGWSERWHGFI